MIKNNALSQQNVVLHCITYLSQTRTVLILTIFLQYENVIGLFSEYFFACIWLSMQTIMILSSLVQGVLIKCVIIHVCNDSIKVIIMDIKKEIAF